MKFISLPGVLLQSCFEHGGRTYPEEACGVLSGPADDDTLTGFHPIENTLAELHQQDPERYPRTPREGYVLDAGAHVRLERELAGRGEKIKVIYHTHVDVGAYFSEEDSTQATWGGEPLFPGMFYLVCGVKNRLPDGAILATFDLATGRFEERRIAPAGEGE